MGACASFPKGLKADASKAPAPEPAPEQSLEAADVEGTEEVKVEQVEKKDDVDTKQQSLGFLLDEGEKNKEETEEKKTMEEVPVKPKEEEQESKEAPTTPEKTGEVKDSMEKNEKEEKKEN